MFHAGQAASQRVWYKVDSECNKWTKQKTKKKKKNENVEFLW